MRALEDKPEEEPEEAAEAEDPRSTRGRQQLIAIAVTLVGSFVLLLLLGLAELGTTLIWGVVFALLCLQTFRGRKWAKWVIVGLAGLFGAGNAYSAASLFHVEGSSWPINVSLVVIYAWAALILVLSRPLAQFMDDQRAKGR